jgi:hypothetical protein
VPEPTPETVNFRSPCLIGLLSTLREAFAPGWAVGLSDRTNVSATGPKVKALDAVTVKAVELVADAAGGRDRDRPVLAPDGTVAVICASESTVKFPDPTLVPLNFTSVAPVKPEPLIVTDVPTGPEDGENPLMEGADDPTTEISKILPSFSFGSGPLSTARSTIQ